MMMKTLKFKKQLWSLSDIVRGYIEISEQKLYMMVFLTLKKIEHNSRYEIPQEFKWSNLTSHGVAIGERIEEAVIKIEDLNPELKNVFTQVHYNKIDDKVLFELVNEINRLNVPDDHNELSSTLLYYMTSAEGRSTGEYITPNSVSELLVCLLNITEGSVYDGTAGVNQLLIEAAKSNGNVRLFGQELNARIWALGKMNLILSGYDQIAEIEKGDTIRNPLFKEGNRLQTFDYVLMNPPFSLSNWGFEAAKEDLSGRFNYGIPSKSNGDLAFVLHALASLNSEGKAAIVVTQGALSRGGADQKIRQGLLNDELIEAVIGLPSKLFYSTGISASVLILNKNKDPKRKGKVLFINAEDEYQELNRSQYMLPSESITKIVETYRQGNEVKGYSRLVSIEEIQDAVLSINQYFVADEINTSIGPVKVDLNSYIISTLSKLPLKELGEFFRGYSISTKSAPNNPTHKIIQLKNVQDGQLIIDDMDSIELSDPKKVNSYEVREGDVLISCRGFVIKVAVVPKVNEKMVLSHNFIGLRPRAGVNPYFIKAFLESPIGQFYLSSKQKGTAVQIINMKDLQDILIPNLELDQQDEIAKQFVQSDNNLQRTIQEAKERHRNEYMKLYDDMGISGSFKQ
jgi:type I restriction enzyme M protein